MGVGVVGLAAGNGVCGGGVVGGIASEFSGMLGVGKSSLK